MNKIIKLLQEKYNSSEEASTILFSDFLVAIDNLLTAYNMPYSVETGGKKSSTINTNNFTHYDLYLILFFYDLNYKKLKELYEKNESDIEMDKSNFHNMVSSYKSINYLLITTLKKYIEKTEFPKFKFPLDRKTLSEMIKNISLFKKICLNINFSPRTDTLESLNFFTKEWDDLLFEIKNNKSTEPELFLGNDNPWNYFLNYASEVETVSQASYLFYRVKWDEYKINKKMNIRVKNYHNYDTSYSGYYTTIKELLKHRNKHALNKVFTSSRKPLLELERFSPFLDVFKPLDIFNSKTNYYDEDIINYDNSDDAYLSVIHDIREYSYDPHTYISSYQFFLKDYPSSTLEKQDFPKKTVDFLKKYFGSSHSYLLSYYSYCHDEIFKLGSSFWKIMFFLQFMPPKIITDFLENEKICINFSDNFSRHLTIKKEYCSKVLEKIMSVINYPSIPECEEETIFFKTFLLDKPEWVYFTLYNLNNDIINLSKYLYISILLTIDYKKSCNNYMDESKLIQDEFEKICLKYFRTEYIETLKFPFDMDETSFAASFDKILRRTSSLDSFDI